MLKEWGGWGVTNTKGALRASRATNGAPEGTQGATKAAPEGHQPPRATKGHPKATNGAPHGHPSSTPGAAHIRGVDAEGVRREPLGADAALQFDLSQLPPVLLIHRPRLRVHGLGAVRGGLLRAAQRRLSPSEPSSPPPLCAPRTIGSFPLAVSVSTAAAAASPGAASPLQGHKRRLSAAHPRAAASQPRARPPPYPLSASAALGSGGAGGSAAGGSGAASALSPAGAAIAAAAAAAAAIAVDAPARVGPERRSREIPGFKGQCSRWDPRPDGSSAPYRRPAGRAGGDVTAVMRRHPARP